MKKLETLENWSAIVADAASLSYRQIAEKHSISTSALQAAFRRTGLPRPTGRPGPRRAAVVPAQQAE